MRPLHSIRSQSILYHHIFRVKAAADGTFTLSALALAPYSVDFSRATVLVGVCLFYDSTQFRHIAVDPRSRVKDLFCFVSDDFQEDSRQDEVRLFAFSKKQLERDSGFVSVVAGQESMCPVFRGGLGERDVVLSLKTYDGYSVEFLPQALSEGAPFLALTVIQTSMT